MYDIFTFIFWLSLSVTFLCLTFWLAQFVVERFLLNTLPRLAELYGRIKYPYQFKD